MRGAAGFLLPCFACAVDDAFFCFVFCFKKIYIYIFFWIFGFLVRGMKKNVYEKDASFCRISMCGCFYDDDFLKSRREKGRQ